MCFWNKIIFFATENVNKSRAASAAKGRCCRSLHLLSRRWVSSRSSTGPLSFTLPPPLPPRAGKGSLTTRSKLLSWPSKWPSWRLYPLNRSLAETRHSISAWRSFSVVSYLGSCQTAITSTESPTKAAAVVAQKVVVLAAEGFLAQHPKQIMNYYCCLPTAHYKEYLPCFFRPQLFLKP